MYRPKGWEKGVLLSYDTRLPTQQEKELYTWAYEAGADAMLEGLKANSLSFGYSEEWEKVSFDIKGNGRAYLVVIPEEE